MSELKAGMMAMIIGSVHEDSPHIGKAVTLKDNGYLEMWGELWNIEEQLDHDAWRALSIHLMPINPEDDPLETTQKESEHVR